MRLPLQPQGVGGLLHRHVPHRGPSVHPEQVRRRVRVSLLHAARHVGRGGVRVPAGQGGRARRAQQLPGRPLQGVHRLLRVCRLPRGYQEHQAQGAAAEAGSYQVHALPGYGRAGHHRGTQGARAE